MWSTRDTRHARRHSDMRSSFLHSSQLPRFSASQLVQSTPFLGWREAKRVPHCGRDGARPSRSTRDTRHARRHSDTRTSFVHSSQLPRFSASQLVPSTPFLGWREAKRVPHCGRDGARPSRSTRDTRHARRHSDMRSSFVHSSQLPRFSASPLLSFSAGAKHPASQLARGATPPSGC